MEFEQENPGRYESKRDQYDVQRKLGEGGFGVTLLARRNSDLRMERLKDWKSLELFQREMKTLETLSHRDIPTFYDHFQKEEGGLAFVQEYIEGESLREIWKEARDPLFR